jgi:hypothetical protein
LNAKEATSTTAAESVRPSCFTLYFCLVDQSHGADLKRHPRNEADDIARQQKEYSTSLRELLRKTGI